eukprot:TRINITY_DN14271_c0_g1_i2.p1 TRINITY_DN14271_c0_g1~~TRINITY_DN14271_c0_g1_i2.p1  ORF type:complete len:505 (-),score=87.15 TRINITY_DN14271_c0_g1_i2:326-1840(-)
MVFASSGSEPDRVLHELDAESQPFSEGPKTGCLESTRRPLLVSLMLSLGVLACVARHKFLQGMALEGGRALSTSEHEALHPSHVDDDPNWGCGLLGKIPGISQDGQTTPETQRFVDALKSTSTFNKVNYWNWNLAPQTLPDGQVEHLSKDFLFIPEQWGPGPVPDAWVRPAGQSPFLDSNGQPCNAEMANIFLGMNEPDIQGSCMGTMMGKCLEPCDDAAVAANDCPAAYLNASLPAVEPNARGMCNCWQHSVATGAGFWPVQGCSAHQPLPDLWNQEEACIDGVISNWKKTAATAWSKGYKYLSAPLMAVDVNYAENFIKKACGCSSPGKCSCTDASCGCPVYLGIHFYAFDCLPEATGSYKTFAKRLREVAKVMENYPFVKGAFVNEVGMLNCAQPSDAHPICVPNSGKYPARSVADHGCPATPELPNGLASFVEQIFEMVISAKTNDGRSIVKGFSWFNVDQDGGTYNLRLFDKHGSINKVGEAYMQACKKWADSNLAIER